MYRSILFVCLGNICRSPTAEGVVRHLADQAAIPISLDSAGTGDWHVGEPPYGPMQRAARLRGYDLSHLRARQFTEQDFYDFDLIIGMDGSNIENIERLRPAGVHTPVRSMLSFHQDTDLEDVPDPYYTREYNLVIDLVEAAGHALIAATASRSEPFPQPSRQASSGQSR